MRAAAGEWRLDSVPLVVLGGAGASEEFGDVVGVARRSDGGFVVGDGHLQQLRVYDAHGRFVRAVGRKGRGPGELRQLHWAGVLPGDTLVAFDWSGWRFSLYGPDGAFVRAFRLERSDAVRWPLPAGVLADGTVLLVGRSMPAAPTRPIAAGTYTESTVVARVRTTDGAVDSLATLPMQHVYRGARGGFAALLPFTARLSLVPAGGAVVAGFGDDSTIALLGADRPGRVIAPALPRVPVDASAFEADRDLRLAGAREFRTGVLEMYRAIEPPSHYPRFDALAADDSGRVWVRAYVADDDAPTRWTVLDTLGRTVARATLPARFHVVRVDGDRVLGRWRDADDVEYVGVFALRRP